MQKAIQAWTTINTDARHFQIMTLSSLLLLLILWSDFAPSTAIIVMTVTAALFTQFLFFKTLKIPSKDFRSPLITSLSLCLLLKASAIWFFPIAAALAMGSKFLLRINNKHIFNPANAGIVILLLLFPNDIWVSPGQWGSTIWLGFALLSLAIIVLSKSRRTDISLFFLGFWFLLTFGRALWLGDPFAIPFHNAQSGALLIFAFFMISDPMTTPDHRMGRFIFAATVAVLAFTLQYAFQVREAIFYALFFMSMTTPLWDMVFKNTRYSWRIQT